MTTSLSKERDEAIKINSEKSKISREALKALSASLSPPHEGVERDPNGVPAGTSGAKLDAGKAPVFQGLLSYFPNACSEVASLSLKGAEKYSWNGWEEVDDGVNRYSDALVRHLLKEGADELVDIDTGKLHAVCVAWNALARLELILKESADNGST